MNSMRAPSRLIPPHASPRLGWSGSLSLIALLAGFGYFICVSSPLVRYITGTMVCSVSGYAWVINRRTKRRFELLASSRNGDSICEFARSFDARITDTWIIRAAHQELQTVLQSCMPDFPVRASDSLLADLELDLDDVEDLLQDVAKRSSRSLEGTEENPYYGRVNTAKDLVLFINAQPQVSAVVGNN